MSKGTTVEAEVIRLRQSIETQMRRRILEAIEVVLKEELTEALGTGRYERGEARRDPPLALFWLLCFGLVMIPAANVHLVGARIRFPLDLIYIPVAVLFVASLVSRPRDPPAERPDQTDSTTPEKCRPGNAPPKSRSRWKTA